MESEAPSAPVVHQPRRAVTAGGEQSMIVYVSICVEAALFPRLGAGGS